MKKIKRRIIAFSLTRVLIAEDKGKKGNHSFPMRGGLNLKWEILPTIGATEHKLAQKDI